MIDIARQRLHNQHLAGTPFAKPEEVVHWLGAVQAQDYAGAKWGLSQRTTGAANAAIDKLFDDGIILRTHVMRPTWHFVLPADIRWLLALTGPRVHAANAHYYRQLELDGAVFSRSHALLAGALQGGKHLTRAELARVLQDGGIATGGLRLGYLIMHAELDAIICSGPRRGKQFTYALLDDRVRQTTTLARDEALAELTRRYFASHGPATSPDYAWWSGLPAAEAKAGLEMVKSHFTHETVDGKTYWFAAPLAAVEVKDPTIHLLPNFDEHFVAYKDHQPSLDPAVLNNLPPPEEALRAHIIVRNGLVIGGWQRTLQKNEVIVKPKLLIPLNTTGQTALKAAAEAYGRFLGLPVTLL
ncbi:MAG: winged helix DNA-binding domain-containing protein [Chloroflexi bacterium]|nr:winged helix DNA-binding domain-containing protein [Chloroflexota bacterium]